MEGRGVGIYGGGRGEGRENSQKGAKAPVALTGRRSLGRLAVSNAHKMRAAVNKYKKRLYKAPTQIKSTLHSTN